MKTKNKWIVVCIMAATWAAGHQIVTGARECFKHAWPVRYLPIPLCPEGTDSQLFEGWQCFKYILSSPYGWWCASVADGAIACETVSPPPAGVTYDYKKGFCTGTNNCSATTLAYPDLPLTDGMVAVESRCYGER
jgi:hypothetical protein